MEDSRIVHIKDIDEARILINKYFSDQFPVPIRGAVTALGEAVDLSYQSNGRLIELKIKEINDILRDGTELDFEDNYGWTRVDYYPDSKDNWAFICAQDRGKIDYWAERANVSKEKIKLLNPVILVYNKSLLVQPASRKNIFGVKLPQLLEDRSKSILAAYINHTELSHDWTDVPF
jgi:hypothetical protein